MNAAGHIGDLRRLVVDMPPKTFEDLDHGLYTAED